MQCNDSDTSLEASARGVKKLLPTVFFFDIKRLEIVLNINPGKNMNRTNKKTNKVLARPRNKI
jgi:hypothetical protein